MRRQQSGLVFPQRRSDHPPSLCLYYVIFDAACLTYMADCASDISLFSDSEEELPGKAVKGSDSVGSGENRPGLSLSDGQDSEEGESVDSRGTGDNFFRARLSKRLLSNTAQNTPVRPGATRKHRRQHIISESSGDEADSDEGRDVTCAQSSSKKRMREADSIREIKCMLQVLCTKVEQNERTLIELQNLQRCRWVIQLSVMCTCSCGSGCNVWEDKVTVVCICGVVRGVALVIMLSTPYRF